MIPIELFLVSALVTSIAAGLLGSLVGVGGGILIIPLLTLVFGVPVNYAIGASIISVIGTSSGSASAFLKDGITNFRVGTLLNAATTSGAVFGAVTSIFLIGSGLSWIIYLAFGTVLLTSAYDLWRKSRTEKRLSVADINVAQNRFGDMLDLKGEYYDTSLGERISYEATRVPEGLSVMFCAGLISGLLGIGSGALKVVGMDRLMKLPFKVSTTTSNFMIGVTAAASAGVFYLKGYVNLLIVGPVAVGVVAGSFLGATFVARSKPQSLRLLFVAILVVTGIEMLQKGLVLI